MKLARAWVSFLLNVCSLIANNKPSFTGVNGVPSRSQTNNDDFSIKLAHTYLFVKSHAANMHDFVVSLGIGINLRKIVFF